MRWGVAGIAATVLAAGIFLAGYHWRPALAGASGPTYGRIVKTTQIPGHGWTCSRHQFECVVSSFHLNVRPIAMDYSWQDVGIDSSPNWHSSAAGATLYSGNPDKSLPGGSPGLRMKWLKGVVYLYVDIGYKSYDNPPTPAQFEAFFQTG